ncbi:hypothetical protein CIB95_10950 [Lottiidibacillus patelloidae]|uniref:CAAX prenyl protease 2/Lysostaphin resistance protein A-like domain-containing protein n=1 Tax=Lottiidibacillus patelloidae TaxID=2670334 RepID=A0A263BSM7_9BACI|nr:CPBP family glutamic-type intramembrane protease [Lottiidibacillus patelloidae]OZM56731.1 hypothetical protein CIB95_10950 [Lottiidibacillus patelloidae]
MKAFNMKLYLIFLGLSSIGIVGLIPYTMKANKELIAELDLNPALIAAIQGVQMIVLTAVLLFVGLLIWKKAGFQSVIIEKWLQKQKITINIKKYTLISIGWGTVASLLIVLTSFTYEKLSFVEKSSTNEPMLWWEAILASFYGGFAEEIMMRLFLVSLLVILLSKLFKQKENKKPIIYVLSIILAAVVFGVLHLPLLTTTDLGFTSISISYVLLMNGLAAIVFGVLYWKKGIEAAFIAHYTTDIWIHYIFPTFFSFTLI